jgi:hypothetical protein
MSATSSSWRLSTPRARRSSPFVTDVISTGRWIGRIAELILNEFEALTSLRGGRMRSLTLRRCAADLSQPPFVIEFGTGVRASLRLPKPRGGGLPQRKAREMSLLAELLPRILGGPSASHLADDFDDALKKDGQAQHGTLRGVRPHLERDAVRDRGPTRCTESRPARHVGAEPRALEADDEA